MAMMYDSEQGWVAEQLGPKSGHWKRLAREIEPKTIQNEGNLKTLKREDPTPLEELDPNLPSQKRSKGKKES